MPVPKRYFHVSQELNHDPELWTFTDKFGDRSLRTWLQILAYLDRSENRWRITEGSFESLGRMVRQYAKTVRSQVEEMIKKGWLDVLETDMNGSPLVLAARNWTKYNRTQEHKRNGRIPDSGTPKGLIDIPSVPTPTPTPTPTPSEDKNIVPPPGGTVNGSLWKSAEEAIGFLNERTRKNFHARHPNGDPTKALIAVESLLRKGYSLTNIRQVIANRCLKWRDDPKMEEFLRPETLFRPSNFSNYLGELGKGVKHDAVANLS